MSQLSNKNDCSQYDTYENKSASKNRNHNVMSGNNNGVLIPKNDADIDNDVSLDQINSYLKLINDSLNMIMLTAVLESKIKNKSFN